MADYMLTTSYHTAACILTCRSFRLLCLCCPPAKATTASHSAKEHNPSYALCQKRIHYTLTTLYALACRNVHPTTTLLDSTAGTDSPQQGVLLFSSQSVLLLQPDANEATLLLQLHLTGVPTAVAHVGKAMWAVADSMAGLCIVDLQQPSCVCRVTADTPLSVAEALFPLPSGATQHLTHLCMCMPPNI